MERIEDIINGLTDEEKELHKELIDECIEREKIVDECKCEENLILFIEKLICLRNSIFDLGNKMYLASLPDDKFYKE